MIEGNRPALALSAGVAPELLTPPVNVLRMSLHPGGMSQQIVNLKAWRAMLLRRLAHEIDVTQDPILVELHRELSSYGARLKPSALKGGDEDAGGDALPILVPMRLRTPLGELSFWSTTTAFGTAVDTTVSELAIESFLPADEATRRALQTMAQGLVSPAI